MPKKGVFGMKEMPLDKARGISEPEHKKRDPEVRIRKVNNGYIVSCSPETTADYEDKQHVKESLEGALEVAKEHLEGKKDEKKD